MYKKALDILKDWKETIGIGFVILLLAFLLRIYNLDILPVFADEAIYIRWAQVMRAEPTLRFLPVSDGKQPLFMWTVIPFFKLLSDPVVAGRAVSVLTGMGSLVGIFVLTYILFSNKKVALTASFFYAFSPFSVFFDRMALVDSMLTMFGLWTFIFAYITAKHARLDTAMITGFFLGAALLTKSPALFFVFLIPTVSLFSELPNKKENRLLYILKLSVLYGVILVVGYGMYNVLRLGPYFHVISSRNQDYVYPLSHVLERPLDPLLPFLHRSFEWIVALGPWVIILTILGSIAINYKEKWKEILVLGMWFLSPIFVVSEFAKVLTARYIYFTIPFAFILASSFFVKVFVKPQKHVKLVGYALLSLFIVISLHTNYLLLTEPEAANLPRSERSGYLEEWTAGTGIYEVSEYIRDEYRKSSTPQIVVGTEGYFGTLPDALQAYLNDIPEIIVVGTGVSFGEVPLPLLESRDSGNRTYFVANSTRIKFTRDQYDDLGLRLIAEYKKADRDENTREFVQNGPYESLYLFEVVKPVYEEKNND